MSESKRPMALWKRNLGLVIVILLGVGSVVLAPKLKSPPQRRPVKEQPAKVRAMSVPRLNTVPRVTGFGRVVPGQKWEAVAEVSGQVTWIADSLRNGTVVNKGTELLRIDGADYRLVLAQAEAQLQVSEAKQKTARDNLTITQKNLELLQKEYKRQQQLASQGVISQTALETNERALLAGQTQFENQQSSLALNSAEHRALLAQRDIAALALQRTVITAPMDVRITQVNIGPAQYANKGQLLFTADGLERAEIEARFSVGILRPLIRSQTAEQQTSVRMGVTGLKTIVRLRTATHVVEWPARVDRVAGSVDPLSQSIGVIVAVDRPHAAATPGERPPLLRDTFVEVELFTAPVKGQIVVPANAIHKSTVYVVNKESRLEIRSITPKFSLLGYTVIAEGLDTGEKIVISDLLSAVEGMLLAPQEDKKSKRQLIKIATGKDPKP